MLYVQVMGRADHRGAAVLSGQRPMRRFEKSLAVLEVVVIHSHSPSGQGSGKEETVLSKETTTETACGCTLKPDISILA